MTPTARAPLVFAAAAVIALGTVYAQREALMREVRAHRATLDAAAGEGEHASPETAAARTVAVLTSMTRRLAASPRAEDRTRLRALLDDPAYEALAIQAIADRPLPEDETALRARLNRAGTVVALQARRGLLRLGRVDEAYPALLAFGQSGVPALDGFLESAEGAPRAYHPKARDYCLAVTATATLPVILEACDGLVALGEAAAARDVLARILASPDAQTRYDAATTAAPYASRAEFRALLEAHRGDPDDFVKQAVAEALAPTPTARPRRP